MLQQQEWDSYHNTSFDQSEPDYLSDYYMSAQTESDDVSEQTKTPVSPIKKIIKKTLFFIFMLFFACGLFGGIFVTIAVAMYIGMLAYSTRNPLVYGIYFVVMSVLFLGSIILIIYEVRKNAKQKKRAVARPQQYVSYSYRTNISRSSPENQRESQGAYPHR